MSFCVAGAALVLLGAAPLAAQPVATDWKAIQKPPLRAFQPPQPKRVVLPNGMVVFLQEDHELPLLRATARIRGGSREETAEKAGLVSLYGQAWRTGGTKTRTGDELDDFLEARGARVETGGGLDSTTISFDCLKDSFDEVFGVFVELMREPEFREDKLTLAKNQLNTGIARRNDDPMGIAGREARKLGYGAASPYARTTEYATVAAVTREDLLRWHRTYVHPNNIILGVVGDFDTKAMEARLKKAFSGWRKGPAAVRLEARFPEPKPGVYFVQKDDVNQSNIRMVHLGTRRDNPDFYAIEVMNEVFGGGFSARLFSNVRSKKGLAYAVGGGVGMNWDHPGLFTLSMGTKSGSTAAAVDALFEEIDNLKKSPPSAEELARAKDAILNSFVFRLDSNAKVLSEQMLYEFYGYPLDSLEKYKAGIEKVTVADVARAAERYVHRDKVAMLVVGKAQDFDRPLSSFGEVTTLDITIPEPGGSKPKAGASSDEGRALLDKVVAGLGGAARLAEVKALRQKSTARMKTPQGEMMVEIDSLTVLPDRLRQQMRTQMMMGTMTTVVTPEASFLSTPMGMRDLPSSQRDAALKDLRTNPIYVAQHAADPKVVVTAGGSEKLGESELRVLDVRLEGAEVRWLVDPSSGRILRSIGKGVGPSGPTEQVTDYSDFREVGGLTLAFKRAMMRNGEDAGSVEIAEIEINPQVDPKLFEKPMEAPKP
jgi:zinc protease